MNKLSLLALAASFVIGEETFGSGTTPCGAKRSPNLPDPQPGTCVDVGKCCELTWPPPLTAKVSCDSSVPGSCYGCNAPGCCCQAGTMVLTHDGKTGAASCCSYFLKDGTMCNTYNPDGTPNCGEEAFLCKTMSNADCDKCGARCTEFYDNKTATQFLI